MDSDSNSSPDSLQDNDDVIFVNHINGPTGRLVLSSYWEIEFLALYRKEKTLFKLSQCFKCFATVSMWDFFLL